jgi:hypothetical protein
MEHISASLDQTLERIATSEFYEPAVLQISQTNQIYVSLDDKTDLEVNLMRVTRKTCFWHLHLMRRLKK